MDSYGARPRTRSAGIPRVDPEYSLDAMTLPRVLSVAAVGAVVTFNLLMVLLAAIGDAPIDTPFVVLWIVGDFVLCLLALVAIERL